ncbi:hypothetical protein LguiA_012892 [Lonicera macranthoides]
MIVMKMIENEVTAHPVNLVFNPPSHFSSNSQEGEGVLLGTALLSRHGLAGPGPVASLEARRRIFKLSLLRVYIRGVHFIDVDLYASRCKGLHLDEKKRSDYIHLANLIKTVHGYYFLPDISRETSPDLESFLRVLRASTEGSVEEKEAFQVDNAEALAVLDGQLVFRDNSEKCNEECNTPFFRFLVVAFIRPLNSPRVVNSLSGGPRNALELLIEAITSSSDVQTTHRFWPRLHFFALYNFRVLAESRFDRFEVRFGLRKSFAVAVTSMIDHGRAMIDHGPPEEFQKGS